MTAREVKEAEADVISTMHWVYHTETTLDRPVREVWPVFRNFFSWYTEYACEWVSGPAYDSGSGLAEDQVLHVKSPMDLPRAHPEEARGPKYYVQRTIRVVPEREIVVVLSGSVYDFRQYTAFYVWRMQETAARTTILIDNFGEGTLFKPLSKGDLSKYYDKFTQNWHRSWSEAFVNLRRVLDSGR
jgi:hypothetical protein